MSIKTLIFSGMMVASVLLGGALDAEAQTTIYVKLDSTPTGETAWECDELSTSPQRWTCAAITGASSYDRDCEYDGTSGGYSDWGCLGSQAGETHWRCALVLGEWKCLEEPK